MPIPDKRLRDVELVLRVLALASGWEDYAKPMKKILTDHIDKTSKADPSEIQQVERRFELACELAHRQLGAKPFHLRGRLNVAALDSFMASTIRLLDSLDGIDLKEKYKELKSDANFMETVTHDTSDTLVVRRRFGLVHSTLTS